MHASWSDASNFCIDWIPSLPSHLFYYVTFSVSFILQYLVGKMFATSILKFFHLVSLSFYIAIEDWFPQKRSCSVHGVLWYMAMLSTCTMPFIIYGQKCSFGHIHCCLCNCLLYCFCIRYLLYLFLLMHHIPVCKYFCFSLLTQCDVTFPIWR